MASFKCLIGHQLIILMLWQVGDQKRILQLFFGTISRKREITRLASGFFFFCVLNNLKKLEMSVKTEETGTCSTSYVSTLMFHLVHLDRVSVVWSQLWVVNLSESPSAAKLPHKPKPQPVFWFSLTKQSKYMPLKMSATAKCSLSPPTSKPSILPLFIIFFVLKLGKTSKSRQKPVSIPLWESDARQTSPSLEYN